MFLEKLIKRNSRLVDCAFQLHREGKILPDTYILDLDSILYNAREIKKEADKYGIELYFMLKQIGRNSLIGQELMKLGYQGAVAVDYREALCYIDNGIHLSNVGHLVQIPKAAMERIIAAKPDYVTVYSYEKILEINEAAKKCGRVQKLLIRISDPDSRLYSGQIGGFHSDELEELFKKIDKLENVRVGGLTVFPALLYAEKENKILPTANLKAMERGKKIAQEHGYSDLNINLPSATCTASIPLISELGGSSGEPGHGLTGTTPLHKYSEQIEFPAYVYVSEISHCFNGRSYCYGGGHYRRGHMENALVGTERETAVHAKAVAPDDDSIDYHFELEEEFPVGECVLMTFRTQIFTVRSQVAVVKGIQSGQPELLGLYSPLGERLEKNW
ncbi:MAG: YhfX family PLP-dependent enzyme [Erysipelotrichaceae bacterium]|nr:YhfX family PLP-dependent enzyme [Erysipelotrichaceae bacterium]